VELLYLTFFDGNVDKKLKSELIRREIELTTMYGQFRTSYQGQTLDDGKVESMLAKSKDAKATEALWKAKHELGNFRLEGKGPTLAEKIIEAVKLRNQFAKKAGFANYFEYGLFLNQMDPQQLDTLMGDVAKVTEAPFQAVRAKLDAAAVKRWGISKTEARRPWFQAGVNDPNLVEDVYSFSPDKYLKGHDPRPLMKKMAGLMGHNVDSVVDKSDLFPRPGKSQHWYLFSLKTPGDIRSIGNVDPKLQDRMGFAYSTLLHEILGHGLGYSLVSAKLPPTLRDLHGITTETDAMMMENQVTSADWLHRVLGMAKKKADATAARAAEYQAAHKLMSTVRFRLLPIISFEREMYKNPEQDLNKLWAKTTKQFLGMDVPADRKTHDWTYKIHFATAPAYYPFYFFADLARAQVEATIKANHGGMLTPSTGQFLREQRKDGLTRHWTQIVEDMTGKPLGTDALAAELAVLTA
jgi:peptidyl-dipeptidase A